MAGLFPVQGLWSFGPNPIDPSPETPSLTEPVVGMVSGLPGRRSFSVVGLSCAV